MTCLFYNQDMLLLLKLQLWRDTSRDLTNIVIFAACLSWSFNYLITLSPTYALIAYLGKSPFFLPPPTIFKACASVPCVVILLLFISCNQPLPWTEKAVGVKRDYFRVNFYLSFLLLQTYYNRLFSFVFLLGQKVTSYWVFKTKERQEGNLKLGT